MENKKEFHSIIKPIQGWQSINFDEILLYKDLAYFLVWRDIKARYAQSILGLGWAVFRPLVTMVVFSVVFGKLAKINSDGVPYTIFSLAAIVPWTYFSSSLTSSSSSLLSSKNMMTKVYFPRLILPIVPSISKLVDFFISFSVLVIMLYAYGFYLSIEIIFLPLLILLMFLCSSGLGMWITSISLQYRDINFAKGYFIQLLLYVAPVVYPASSVPDNFRLIYGIFPMAGVIEGFRSILLKTNSMPWDLIIVGSIFSILFFITGAFFFKRMEKYIADVA